MMAYLKFPIITLFIGLLSAGLLGWNEHHNFNLVLQSLITVAVLSVLEISLSFDNAVVNATVLRKMDSVWSKRFLFWGMIIAVFGMRFIFPLIIVSVAGSLSLAQSLTLAFENPTKYAQIMQSSHLSISSYGGSFLLLVGLDFFISEDKKVHWISSLEQTFFWLSKISYSEIILTLLVLILIMSQLDGELKVDFIRSSLYGVITYLVVRALSDVLGDENSILTKGLSSGLGMFLYLEVLDASFSFDGVIGAFAITKQIYEIIIGLGVGAFFVRGLTIYLVENKKLEHFQYLEHGAFYALLALSFFMLFDTFFHFSQWSTGLTGAGILLVSIFWSVYENRQSRAS